MIFTPLQYDSGRMNYLKVGGSKTISKGDPLEIASDGYAERADENTTGVRWVALESASSTTEGDEILAVYTKGIEFEAECAANTAQAQVDLVFALDSNRKVENTLDGTYTEADVFLVTSLVGATTDKKVRGYFLDRISEANAA
jgi:hypothetical protein